ncbi:MAG: heme ABC exporter ATP-binding protein CcmA [Actinobacteria bacterium]|nr:heme ABC exporter ATP-binding protein CcmA [Actinomycetota bacterium]
MALAAHFRSATALAGRYPVLAGLDLDVSVGEVLVVQGANGAGKTSLLRVCAGLLPVVAGTAEVMGCDLKVTPTEVRRHVGLLGHSAGLYDDLTVLENVRFAVRAARGKASLVEGALERVGMAGRLLSVPAFRLSAGQRRRTALAVLLARNPRLWLLDEPHAGLDAQGRDLVDSLVREVSAGGATVVLASHEPERSVPLADRVVLIAGGRAVSSQPELADQQHPGAVPLMEPTLSGSSGPRTQPSATIPEAVMEEIHVA